MRPINNDYTFCPSCGQKIYNYEKSCGICGTQKVNLDDLSDVEVTWCPDCGRKIPMDGTYCPSCGKLLHGKKAFDNGTNYEATNPLQRLIQDCRGGLFALILAANAIWCSIFGIFYGVLCLLCSFVGIGIQVRDIIKRKTRYGYIFIIATIILIIVAIVVMIVCAQARAAVEDAIVGLIF